MSYILWFDDQLNPPEFWRHDAIHVARTTHQALEIIELLGYPLIVAFGYGSIELAKHIRKHNTMTNMTYRLTCEYERTTIQDIMTNG